MGSFGAGRGGARESRFRHRFQVWTTVYRFLELFALLLPFFHHHRRSVGPSFDSVATQARAGFPSAKTRVASVHVPGATRDRRSGASLGAAVCAPRAYSQSWPPSGRSARGSWATATTPCGSRPWFGRSWSSRTSRRTARACTRARAPSRPRASPCRRTTTRRRASRSSRPAAASGGTPCPSRAARMSPRARRRCSSPPPCWTGSRRACAPCATATRSSPSPCTTRGRTTARLTSSRRGGPDAARVGGCSPGVAS